VEIYAIEPGPELRQLLSGPGSYFHHARTWDHEIFAGAAIAVGDMAGDMAGGLAEDAAAFAKAAKAAGVLVNIIDQPAYGQFNFGSIVNRSPVVIGISTDGAAPILAQAIRQRIETLLPPALASWAALAKSLRGQVKRKFPTASRRRAFWNAFVEKAFLAAPPGSTDHMVNDGLAPAGGLTLVGAGPGEAGLLTLKAVRAMQSADIILYEPLVGREILELARREAKCLAVQMNETTMEMLTGLWGQGRQVVCLFHGDVSDPWRQNIPGHIHVAVVPGLSGTADLPDAVMEDLRAAI
jgi:uroporphyrin-III C-methyltransferase/precorrin-2 dehydrogenase/sirohydrochlorin ferrochelatase